MSNTGAVMNSVITPMGWAYKQLESILIKGQQDDYVAAIRLYLSPLEFIEQDSINFEAKASIYWNDDSIGNDLYPRFFEIEKISDTQHIAGFISVNKYVACYQRLGASSPLLSTNISIDSGVPYIVKFVGKKAYVNGTYIGENETAVLQSEPNSFGFPRLIIAKKTNVRFYYAKGNNGTGSFDLVPAVRSDGTIGILDRVSRQFTTNKYLAL